MAATFGQRIKFLLTGKGAARNFGHNGATDSRFTGDWMAQDASIDKFIERDLKKLRDRSVALERDDGYVRRFLSEVESNVVGHKGITFRPQCRKRDLRTPNGISREIDADACLKLEQAWKEFSTRQNFTTQQRFTRARYEQLAVRSVARDGGHLTRFIRGWDDNDFGFAIQPIRITSLDPRFKDDEKNVYMSIRFDEWDRPITYYLKSRKPKSKRDSAVSSFQYDDKTPIAAEDIRHLFIADDFDQSQGKPWTTASMIRLRMLSAYEEAEVIAAREQAQKTEYFEQNEDSEWVGEQDAMGNFLQPSEPLSKHVLPRGMKANLISPEHPNANYPLFRKAMLRGITAPLVVNYNTLANDLEGVNFSSIRSGTLSERELWKMIQSWFIDDFEGPVFDEWLPQAILTGRLGFSINDLDRIGQVEFAGRRWAWVDPLKDIMAAKNEVALGVNSRSRIAADRGLRFNDLLEENSVEQTAMNEAGLAAETK